MVICQKLAAMVTRCIFLRPSSCRGGGFCAIVDVKKLFRSLFFGDEKGFKVGISMFLVDGDLEGQSMDGGG